MFVSHALKHTSQCPNFSRILMGRGVRALGTNSPVDVKTANELKETVVSEGAGGQELLSSMMDAKIVSNTSSWWSGLEQQQVWSESMSSADAWCSGFLPIEKVQHVVEFLHNHGMSYWGAALCLPFFAKALITMPLITHCARSQAPYLSMLPAAIKEVRQCQSNNRGNTEKLLQEMSAIKKKYGFNPPREMSKQFWGMFVQFPIHLTCLYAICTMHNTYPEWKRGGAYWFSDLSLSDPTWVLPATATGCMLLCVFLNIRLQTRLSTKYDVALSSPFKISLQTMNRISYVFALSLLPVAHAMPAGFNLYMIANILSFSLQTHILRSDLFRNLTNMPSNKYEFKFREQMQLMEKETRSLVTNKTITQEKKSAGKREKLL
ncbi:inner membrane protein [Reticulomyxa filosa]|uniref:Inner membrane protein n=1 Tax=Reticulomyxa filosa TaxID=46433 RepID=X6LTM7_RETFI|nr:inner membrane protein [Reticulomyxa filosa]|eukprot:ETO04452.1 inner membrane protein [Reticulomyxa filosa]